MKERGDFWSRRKQRVEAEAEAEIAEQVAVEEAQSLEALAEQSDEEILEELGLQDPDTLKAGDDFSAFMAKTVPTRLRNRALRKLWVSDPVFANLDALLDYGEDFTINPLGTEVIQTTYQVGKGLMAHVKEMERQEKAAAQALLQKDQEPAEQDQPLALVDDPAAEKIEDLHTTEEQPALEADVSEDITDEMTEDAMVLVAKKRMRFVINAQP